MATSKPSHPRVSPSSISSPVTGRRSPRPPGSPDHRLPATTDKPSTATTKLKHRPTTTTTTNRTRSPSTAAPRSPQPIAAKSRQPAARKPIENKPPSPSARQQRAPSTPTTRTTRERSPKPSSATTSGSSVPRPLLTSRTSSLPQNRGTKAARPAKAAAYTRSKSLDQKRKEVTAVPSAFVDNSPASDSEAADIKAELEAKESKYCLVEDTPKSEAGNEYEDLTPVHQQAESMDDEAVAGRHGEEPQPESTLVTENEGGTIEEAKEEPSPVCERPALEVKTVTAETRESPVRGAGGSAKKETPRSNDVIEEVRSKFLEKRRNKVLALVGAFESVMALQEPEEQQQRPRKGKESSEEGASTPIERREQ